MPLKAVLFDFNGVILDDEPIHKQLIGDLLLAENLKPQPGEFERFCLGRSDRACLKDLLSHRGRCVTDSLLDQLITQKAAAYRQRIQDLDPLPLFPGLESLLAEFQAAGIKIAVVTGALRSEVKAVLERARLHTYFAVIVAAEDISTSKPSPEGYRLAVQRLERKYPELELTVQDCLAIEDSFAGIEAAKRAGIPVVGVAHTYPFHMLQRRANWAVDYLHDLELDRIRAISDR